MNDRKLDIDIDLLQQYRPIAEAASHSVKQIAKKLSEIDLLRSKAELSKNYQDEINQHLIYMQGIHGQYEAYKKRVITYVKSKNTTEIELGSQRLRIDERANVLFLDHTDGQKILL